MGVKSPSSPPRNMCRLYLLVLLKFFAEQLVFCANFTVSYLTADRTKTFVKNKQGRIISGAMSYAIEKVNDDPDLLSEHRLGFVWADTHADTLSGTLRLTQAWKNGAVAFFGPEDSCDVEARVAAAWNLPMISYKLIFGILLSCKTMVCAVVVTSVMCIVLKGSSSQEPRRLKSLIVSGASSSQEPHRLNSLIFSGASSSQEPHCLKNLIVSGASSSQQPHRLRSLIVSGASSSQEHHLGMTVSVALAASEGSG
ncbi:hypothetical protein LSAT2_003910 [Lamellibrachia satsuma]|nr:hypothetical protein LSAT2_003910 [Lamellibrachia satsuma]